MKYRTTGIAILIAVALSVTLVAEDFTTLGEVTVEVSEIATVGEEAPDFSLSNAKGEKINLSDFAGQYVVLEWVNYDCPFVKKHYRSNNMQGLQATYTKKDVVWLSICSSAPGKQGYFVDEELSLRIKEEKSGASSYLVDADGIVGRLYEAKTTPHIFIINPEGVLAYAGAIDDVKSTKAEDIEGAVNYVQTTLDAALADKVIEISSTKSYGCSVKYAK